MKFRIVLLLDSLKVSAWVWESVLQIHQSSNTEIVLLGINQNPIPSGTKSPFLYRAYRAFDRKLFLNYPDAFAQKDLRDIPNWNVPEISIHPTQKKYSDYFSLGTIEELKAFHPDLILRLGFRILRGDILKLSKLGVWSFHHGDNQFYKGGPPAFWEVMLKKEITGVTLQRLSEKLDDGQVLYKSFSQTDPLSVQRNANKIFWLSSFIIPRVLKEIEVKGKENWEKGLQNLQSPKNDKTPILTPPSFWQMLGLGSNLLLRNFGRKIAEGIKKPYWEILVAENNTNVLSSRDFHSIVPPPGLLSKGSFWADPFPVEKDGKTWVFYEDFNGNKKKGRIGVAQWDGRELQENRIVLEEDYHLSYPFIWKDNNEYYLIPESGEVGKIFYYKAIDFPIKWKKMGVFFEKEAYDPTILKIENVYWLFVNQRPHSGTSVFIELYAYYTTDLFANNWKAHALNPIVSDVRSSRPAGRIYQKNGKLFRPAQDSGLRYGHRIKIQEILVLNEKEYQEKTVQTMEPNISKSQMGVHTLNFTDHWVFSDAYYRK
ncbi:glucosamine inositolphosphorylceramide transferase family protein [Algoriphagus sp. PAP.12]|uniref:glucosamine inositolphosphorylceramide transferase family protein n=1 Tax=Algoriphagus sp. PAP.12 TaxID=2996678 RepID=UPI00227AB8AC|nr:hypothetical protein [Algoriphagus sp. PAP.12]